MFVTAAAAGPVQAAEYHVAPGGSDEADGSEGSPWATLQHAADSAAPGDDVVVSAGEYAGFTLTASGTAAAPIRFAGQGRDSVVNVEGAEGDGIRLEGASHVAVVGFSVSGPSGAGIRAIGGTGVRIEENRIDGCGGPGVALQATRDARLANNVVWGTGGHGILLRASAGSPAPSGNVVVNNTVHVTAADAWCAWLEPGGVSGMENNRFFNNVFMADVGGAGAIGFDGTAEPGYSGARNALTDRFTTDGGATVIGLSAFQRGEDEVASLATAPTRLFVGTDEADYRLRAGCPAVEGGVATHREATAPDRDIVGVRRPVGPSWDIGAYEFCTGWTCTGEMPDAGTDAGSDAGGDAGGGGGDEGCGCATAGGRRGGGWWIAALAGLAPLCGRRRSGAVPRRDGAGRGRVGR